MTSRQRKKAAKAFKCCIMLRIAISFIALDVGRSMVIIDIIVPSQVRSNTTVNLSCRYELGEENLYSLTWWKDEKQFFSYSPGNVKNKKVRSAYDVYGIDVDEHASTGDRVVIRNVTQWTSGEFKCELVSEDTFEKDSMKKNMTVVVMPEQQPKLQHSSRIYYSPGETFEASCTSEESVPLPEMEWQLNEELLNSLHSTTNSTKHKSGLYSKTSRLKLILEDHNFYNGEIVISCSAFLTDNYKQVSTVKLYEEGHKIVSPSQKLSGNNGRSTRALTRLPPALQVAIWTPILIRLIWSL